MRNQETSKHDYGHALLIAGSYGKMGCAILAARAALRSGCGLVSVHLPSSCVAPMQAAFPEAMVSIDASPTLFTTVPEHLDRYTAIAVGPGIGTEEPTQKALHALLLARPADTPLVLDADALNILAPLTHSDNQAFLPDRKGTALSTNEIKSNTAKKQSSNCIITPHAREYERLFGDADPAEMAAKHNVIIVKKAHNTCVYSPDGQMYENHTGNAGMATAGSGDVLTGILLGMLCSNHLHAKAYEITCRAVETHGKTGDITIEKQSESSLIASDLVENLKHISTDITEC